MKSIAIIDTGMSRGRRMVKYSITDSSGIHGPIVDWTSLPLQQFLDQALTAWVEPVDYYAALEATLGSEAYNKLREELKNIGATRVRMGEVVMNVTFPNQTNPEDTRAELQSRIDSDLGAGTLDTIAQTIAAALGVNQVVIERENIVPL